MNEQKLADTYGKFTQVVKKGRKLSDAQWTSGRILLSNKRLVCAADAGKRTIPLSKVTALGGRHDMNQAIAQVSGYVSVRFGDHVVLIAPDDGDVETELYRALLDRTIVMARHPAVEGGVVQDTEWTKGRVSVEAEAVCLALADGTFVELKFDDIGNVQTSDRTVNGSTRTVIETEHSDDGTSIQTYLTGDDRASSLLNSLLSKGVERNDASLDLDSDEQQVLMALYSGVSPFEIPDFTGLPVEDVEEMFERLVELEVLDEIRVRREVGLTARGRNIASQSIGDQ